VASVPILANSVNLVDGSDGSAASICLMAAIGLTVVGGVVAGWSHIGLGLAVAGALVGFLAWNRPPAKVFLGDGGAYALGCLLAVLAAQSSVSFSGTIGSLVCLSVLGFELGTTVVRRSFGRASLSSGDRDHVYDLLGHLIGRDRATLAFAAAGGVAAILGASVAMVPPQMSLALAAVAAVLGTVAVLMVWRAAGLRLRNPR
jgi:UDP-GlcNAc:undecaprenyl-phosphate GlcNAc-1-phosphate transferase